MADRCLLYYITDRMQLPGDEAARRRALLQKIAEAANAGVDYIQLRETDLSARDLEILAREVVSTVRNSAPSVESPAIGKPQPQPQRKARLLINSRTDVALAAGADGVHLRSEDITPSDVRHIWTSCGAGATARIPAPIISVSCHTPESVMRAASEKPDLAIFAPVFGKQGALTAPPAGLVALRDACRSDVPVLALGGVTLQNAASCLNAGAAGVAGIRLFQENKIEDVVRALFAL